MRIFKREFKKELTEGMYNGECIITKVNDTMYGNFIVHRKTAEGCFPYLGCFSFLQEAITYVQAIEKPEDQYEYHLTKQPILKEDWEQSTLQLMGALRWELCGVQPISSEDKCMFIYKRKLQPTAFDDSDSKIEYTVDPKVSMINTDGKSITYCFGKSGEGITDELIMLGDIVKDLSKRYRVYLYDDQFDVADDLYYITLELRKK